MNTAYNEFEMIPSDSPALDYIMKGDGEEQFPVAGGAPDPDPVYQPSTDPHDPELEEPLEEYTERVPQNYDLAAEALEADAPEAE